MKLILIRHGNTFDPGDKVIWVGSQNDLPLVDRGIEQGLEVGEALKASSLSPDAIYSGPLKRTRLTAEIIRETVGLEDSPHVDKRLDEIDYGLWSGLTNEEIVENFGDSELSAWNESGEWPDAAGFKPTALEIEDDVKNLLSEVSSLDKECVCCVSSNGRLRFFLKQIPGLYESFAAAGKLKVKTGNVCVLELSKGANIDLLFWNASPEALVSI